MMETNEVPQKTSFNQIKGKIILLGDYGVGKTSLLKSFSQVPVRDLSDKTPIISGTQLLRFIVDEEEVLMKIWDTVINQVQYRISVQNGQEKYRSITISFYKETQGVFLCFDLTDKKSFDNLQVWIKQLKQHADENFVTILLGLKKDLDQAINQSEIDELTKQLRCPFYKVSALQDINVAAVFQEMAIRIKKNFIQEQLDRGDQTVTLRQGKRTENQQTQVDNSFCSC